MRTGETELNCPKCGKKTKHTLTWDPAHTKHKTDVAQLCQECITTEVNQWDDLNWRQQLRKTNIHGIH
jgi:hypothetical protein